METMLRRVDAFLGYVCWGESYPCYMEDHTCCTSGYLDKFK